MKILRAKLRFVLFLALLFSSVFFKWISFMSDFFQLYETVINDSPLAFGFGFLTYAATTLFASLLLDIITFIYGKIKKHKN